MVINMESNEGYKIRVNSPEESEEIQKILFSLGFGWANFPINEKVIRNMDKVFLFFYFYKGRITFVDKFMEDDEGSGEDYFYMHRNPKISLNLLRSKEFQEELKKRLLVESLANG